MDKKKKIKLNHKVPPRLTELNPEERKLALIKQKKCDSTALYIVQKLIECPVDESAFLQTIKFINQSHYQDVVEERAISKLCGYPICCNVIPDMPAKKYFISTKCNKVYDITERKNFCTNFCYKASARIKAQMLTSPLWYRDQEQIPDFQLLPKSEVGAPGEEINQGIIKLEHPNEFTSVSQFTSVALEDIPRDVCARANVSESVNSALTEFDLLLETNEFYKKRYCEPSVVHILIENASYFNELSCQKTEKPVPHEQTDTPLKSILKMSLRDKHKKNVSFSSQNETKSYENNAITNSENNIIGTVAENKFQITTSDDFIGMETSDVPDRRKISRFKNSTTYRKTLCSNKIMNVQNEQVQILSRLSACMKEWFTVDTLIYLYGVDVLDKMSRDECLNKNAKQDAHKRKQYELICKKLNLMELEDMQFDRSVTGRELKPLPRYEELQKECERLDMRVLAFYSGTDAYEDDLSDVESDSDTKDLPAILPLVDSLDMTEIRKKIFLTSLNRIIPKICETFKLSLGTVLSDIKKLVNTFIFTATNITFKMSEWSLITLMFIKLLSMQNEQLKKLFVNEEMSAYIDVIAKQNSLNVKDLHSYLQNVTEINVDNFLNE